MSTPWLSLNWKIATTSGRRVCSGPAPAGPGNRRWIGGHVSMIRMSRDAAPSLRRLRRWTSPMVSASTGYRCGRRAWPVLAALFVSASLAADAGAQGSAATDRAALLALYEASGGPSWRVRTNWLSDEPLGDWHGVATDAGGRVTVLSLEENGLTGTLSPEIGNLSRLGQVHLWGNSLTGPVPAALWSLPLELVALTGNQVTGTLPPEVGRLADLGFLDLGWTAMTGALPQSMTNLASLDFLRIEGSYLCAPPNAAFQALAGDDW